MCAFGARSGMHRPLARPLAKEPFLSKGLGTGTASCAHCAGTMVPCWQSERNILHWHIHNGPIVFLYKTEISADCPSKTSIPVSPRALSFSLYPKNIPVFYTGMSLSQGFLRLIAARLHARSIHPPAASVAYAAPNHCPTCYRHGSHIYQNAIGYDPWYARFSPAFHGGVPFHRYQIN